MHYQVSRNGQTYGPYTLEDIQRYVGTGNVLPTDLAKTEEMTTWVPVSQLLGPPSELAPPANFSTPSYANPAPSYAQPAFATQPAAAQYQDAPNLHWGLVLLFGFLTCTLFMPIWNTVVSAWLRKVQPNANALFYWLGLLGLLVVNFIVGAVISVSIVSHGATANDPMAMLSKGIGLRATIWLAIFVVKLIARYSEMASLEEHFNGPEPLGLRLSGVMVFFFGGVYLQYHINKINEMKKIARYSAGRAF